MKLYPMTKCTIFMHYSPTMKKKMHVGTKLFRKYQYDDDIVIRKKNYSHNSF